MLRNCSSSWILHHCSWAKKVFISQTVTPKLHASPLKHTFPIYCFLDRNLHVRPTGLCELNLLSKYFYLFLSPSETFKALHKNKESWLASLALVCSHKQGNTKIRYLRFKFISLMKSLTMTLTIARFLSWCIPESQSKWSGRNRI